MAETKQAVWRIKKGSDRRFRSGHPWVYSNELTQSPKGIEPGAPVELQDAGGGFLARGYGNPASLIAFRAVSRDPDEREPLSAEGVLWRLKRAARLRAALGLAGTSHRLCFGEADSLPGLVIDRYLLDGAPARQVFAVQAHTAGMSRILPDLPAILEKLAATGEVSWENTGIVFHNDVSIRKLEGLEVEEPRVVRELNGVNLNGARVRVRSAVADEPLIFQADLKGGQKTGFFLDQASNVQMVAKQLSAYAKAQGLKKVRILDLCCYVAQWSTQLSRFFKGQGLEVEVTLVDASAAALEHARQNVKAQGAQVDTVKGDVLKDLGDLKDRSFDVVISDPPALIKGRKDIPAGTHAYLQLNTQTFRLVKKGGVVVASSCSALFNEEEFLKTLSKAAYRNKVSVRWVARGLQAPDHPILAEFPEGQYLKLWMGLVD